jgi:hypothetical protein
LVPVGIVVVPKFLSVTPVARDEGNPGYGTGTPSGLEVTHPRTQLGRAGASLALAVAVVAALSPRAAHACAGCRNPSLPVARLSSFTLGPGEVKASLAATATAINTVHRAGCADPANCHEVPVQPAFVHDQNIYSGELRTMIEVGITRAFGIEAHVPLRLVRSTIEYKTPTGAPYTPLDPDVHHRDETLVGLGDPWLLGRVGGTRGGFWLSGRTGVSLPLGRTQENPFALGDMGLRHQHIQFGNGTFDPVVAVDAGRSFGKVQASAYGQAQWSLYENRHGFRAGSRYLTGVQGGGRLGMKLMGMLGLDLLRDSPERWDGEIRQDGFLGRTEVLGGVSLIYPLGDTIVSVNARFPLYRRIIAGSEDPGTLSSPVILSFTVSRTFAGLAPR